jgi:hypothetical protein
MKTAMGHVGIAAVTAEGAALCYKAICVEGTKLLGPHAHPEVSLHGFSLGDYMACFERGDWQGVAALMLGSAEKLARMGADFLICPANMPHNAMPYVEPRSPLPWLHIADVVAAEAAALPEHARLWRAQSIRNGWRRAGSNVCGRPPPSARNAPASSTRNWCAASSSRTPSAICSA